MARHSPLQSLHESSGAVLAPYGPEGEGVAVLQVYSGIDREYAAIRKSAAILDLPHRAVLSVTGTDRLSFLNRMLTQELKGLPGDGKPPFVLRRSLWLNRKGRIDADINVIAQPESILLEVDIHAARRTLDGLNAFIIADDVQIADLTEQLHQLSLHGPHAAEILARCFQPVSASQPVTDLAISTAGLYEFEGRQAIVWRVDSTGGPAYSVALAVESAVAAYLQLAESSEHVDQDRARPDRGFELHGRDTNDRAIRTGWHAFNIARIEAGTALYNIDFGATNLPHEMGEETLKDRVSFTKGCYLGQEVVARMNALGHPKQRLVALDLLLPPGAPSPEQPVTGSLVFAAADPSQPPIGAVTSSAISPMLGGIPVCYAMVKYASSLPDCGIYLEPSPGVPLIRAKVRESLRFWPPPR